MENQSERAEEIWIAKYRAALNVEPIPQPWPEFWKIREGVHTLWQTASLQVGKLLATQRERRSQRDPRPPTHNLEGPPTLAPKREERKPNDDKSTKVLPSKTKLAL